MDYTSKRIYKCYNESLTELKSTIANSISYNSSCKKLIIQKNEFQVDCKPYAILGFGKSSSFLVERLCSILPKGNRLFATNLSQETNTSSFETLYSNHPIPSINNFEQTKRVIKQLCLLPRNSTLIVVASGGGSSMFSLPEENVLYKDKILINDYWFCAK